MVRLGDEDGNVAEYSSSSEESIQETIRKGGEDMLSVIDVGKEMFQTMNVDPEVVGVEVSEILTGYRERVVFGLLVFRKELLPLSLQTVRDVEQTLKKYFRDSSFEQFQALRSVIKKEVEKHKRSANFTEDKFMILSADMQELILPGKEALKEVVLELKEDLDTQTKMANESKEDARWKDKAGKASSISSILASALLAKGLMTTGGLIAACPPLAPVVFCGGIALAVKAKKGASRSVENYKAEKQIFDSVSKQLEETVANVTSIKTDAIDKLAACLQGCGSFFARIAGELDGLSPENIDGDDDAQSRILHRKLQKEADQVIKSCIEYGQCANKVKTSIQVLDKFRPEDYKERVEEWTEKTNKKLEEMWS